MKKLRKKLVLSVAALALCCATLVSTTYAWYTSNTNVTTNSVSGTSQANTDSLLLVSTTGLDGSFSSSADITSFTRTTLSPVQYSNISKALPEINEWTPGGTDVGGEASEGAYISFPLYFRGSKTTISEGTATTTGVDVLLKTLTISNTTAELPAKDVLSTTGLGTSWNVSTDSTYTIDVLRTLKFGYYAESETSTDGSNITSVAGDANAYDPSRLFASAYKSDSIKDGTVAGTANAHEYYTAVTGKTIESTGTNSIKATLPSSINFGKTPASTATGNSLKVMFYFFIDGWDLECFDAVQGQSISISLSFSSESNTQIAAA